MSLYNFNLKLTSSRFLKSDCGTQWKPVNSVGEDHFDNHFRSKSKSPIWLFQIKIIFLEI